MAVDSALRLAWQAGREGRLGMRDALITLALAESGPADAVWSGRCWHWLLGSRTDHFFAPFGSLEEALADGRVRARLKKLKESYPEARVQRMLERAAVLRGTYTGRKPRLRTLLEELLGPEEHKPARRPDAHLPAPFLPMDGNGNGNGNGDGNGNGALARRNGAAAAPAETLISDDGVYTFYLTVLLAIAMLLASTLHVSDQGSNKAA
jgi:hypothetical protein